MEASFWSIGMANYRRVSIQVDEELYQRLNRLFEWGERNRVLVNVLEWLCEKIEKHGRNALVILLREETFDELITMRRNNGND